MNLYHYCCEHSAREILKTLTVNPNRETPLKVSWWTDLEYPDRDALGLTSHHLNCDRTAFRYTAANPSLIVRWGRVRSRAPRALIDSLELTPGAAPAHWFVSDRPVPVTDLAPVKLLRETR